MCGLAGILSFTDKIINDGSVIRMRDSMAHRGPDGAGLWVSPDRKIGLGHRRLSIIDLSQAAAQPMSNEDGSLLVIYNGEIYNHAEIRKELIKTGKHRWKTDHSDTEVILHAFEEWGIDCLKRFVGMFAIALWDVKKQQLWLVRDRLGIKPLYYCEQNGFLFFASEIKAILSHPSIPRSMNEEAFFHYLTFLTTPAPSTLFTGIKKLPAATYLRIGRRGEIFSRKYWDVWDHTEPLVDVSEAEIAERLITQLRVSVKLRKISDVPMGVFLSGGVDSSVNARLFSEDSLVPIKTFSIGYQGELKTQKNETDYARQMANLIGSEHHEKLLSIDDFMGFLPKMVYQQDEPIADPVCVPFYYVSKLARDNGVTVAHVGEGSDELFCGYPKWKKVMRIQEINDRLPFSRTLDWLGMSIMRMAGKDDHYIYGLLSRAGQGLPIFWGGAEGITEVDKQRLLSTRLKNKFKGRLAFEAIRPIYDHFCDRAWEKTPLNWMSYLDINLRLPELLLMRADKMSMLVSLECRVPFLDHKFVELAMSIPTGVKTKDHQLKYILKKSVRGVIPDAIIDRKKQGFSAPLRDWFPDKLGQEFKSVLVDLCKKTDYFEASQIESYLEKGKAWKMWPLFNLALWHKQFIEGETR